MRLEPGFEVINYTDRSLDIFYVDAGHEFKVYQALDPGMSVPLEVGIGPTYCTAGELIARDASGIEVARRTEPICNHEQWVIGPPP